MGWVNKSRLFKSIYVIASFARNYSPPRIGETRQTGAVVSRILICIKCAPSEILNKPIRAIRSHLVMDALIFQVYIARTHATMTLIANQYPQTVISKILLDEKNSVLL